MKVFDVQTIYLENNVIHSSTHKPIEIEATSHDKAAKLYYKKTKKDDNVSVTLDYTTRYYSRNRNVMTEYVLVSGVMNEYRRILL